jgi:hypothetical protein
MSEDTKFRMKLAFLWLPRRIEGQWHWFKPAILIQQEHLVEPTDSLDEPFPSFFTWNTIGILDAKSLNQNLV